MGINSYISDYNVGSNYQTLKRKYNIRSTTSVKNIIISLIKKKPKNKKNFNILEEKKTLDEFIETFSHDLKLSSSVNKAKSILNGM